MLVRAGAVRAVSPAVAPGRSTRSGEVACHLARTERPCPCGRDAARSMDLSRSQPDGLNRGLDELVGMPEAPGTLPRTGGCARGMAELANWGAPHI